MTTEEALAGITAMVILAKYLSASWVCYMICFWARGLRKRDGTDGNLATTIFNNEALRIVAGGAITFVSAATLFLLRIPWRAMRQAGRPYVAETWLGNTIYFETVLSVLIVIGMTLIMWSGFRRLARPLGVVVLVAFLSIAGFVLGVAVNDYLVIQFSR